MEEYLCVCLVVGVVGVLCDGVCSDRVFGVDLVVLIVWVYDVDLRV